MRKTHIKYVVWYIVMVVAIAVYISLFIQPQMQYAEGWSTFYYDQSYISSVMDNGGISKLTGSFIKQFFHHSWHGIALLTIFLLFLAALLHFITNRLLKKINKQYIKVIAIIAVQAVALSLIANSTKSQLGHDPMLAQLSNMARNEQWDDIINTCKEHSPVNNLLYQNILNMALAEKGELGDRLLEEPLVGFQSVYVTEVEGPEVAAILSDVYYSMGHIAQSQMYAFEANEKMDNLSPRLLQRLAVTNILFKQYDVARKYLHWLSKTIYYKDWADDYLAFINNNETNPNINSYIAEKRRCIFPDNRFSGIKGIDDDLLNVARNTLGTRQCKVTLQYLGSLYILAQYPDQFKSMIQEFGGSSDLPTPLPKYFESYYKQLSQQ